MKRFLAAALLLVLVCGMDGDGISQPSQTGTLDKIRIAVLRESGALVPFAEFYRGQWWNPWPEPNQNRGTDEPIIKSLGDHSDPWFLGCGGNKSPWYSSTPQGGPLVLYPSELVEVSNHGGNNWAWMTNLENRKKFDPNIDHDSLGFALSANIKIDQMVQVDPESNEAIWFREQMKDTFVGHENAKIEELAAQIGKDSSFWEVVPLLPEQRELTQINITDLMRSVSGVNGRDLYSVVLEKKYHPPGVPKELECAGRIYFLYAWVFKENNGKIIPFDIQTGTTNCDGKERPASIERFSTFRLGGRDFVATLEHDYEVESYVIYEVTENGLDRVLETFAGGL